MRIFVSEFLVGGASTMRTSTLSMRREGLAMLQAVVDDIAQLPDCSVVTTIEAGLSISLDGVDSFGCDVIPIESAAHEAIVFQQLLETVDAVLVIAPETDGVLFERCRRVRDAGVTSWNCSLAAIELCGDKLRLANHLQSHGLPTIPTMRVDLNRVPSDQDWPLSFKSSDNSEPVADARGSECEIWPIVLKPIDGAGSSLTFLVRNRHEWTQAAELFREAGAAEKCLAQPYVAGRALSIGVNISLDGRQIECLSVGEQRLSDDGRFRYLGGIIPASIPSLTSEAINRLVLRACRTIPGLAGYVGLDLLLTIQGDPLIVEINPRLTTAYVGYRQLCLMKLPQFWISPPRVPPLTNQKPGQIEFVIS